MNALKAPPDWLHWSIADLLAHRGEAIWLTKIIDYSTTHIRCLSNVRENWCNEGVLAHWVHLELMAQAVAAHAGVAARRQNQSIQPGFVLGSRRIEFSSTPCLVHDPVTIAARFEVSDGKGVARFHCEVFDRHGQVLAASHLKVYQAQDMSPWFAN